ncbi:hypothetical protein diail_1068 [Diaporthe ilicicola]|nr:hypothetical protein diail_1068 [Diaporthe ilicicola]
MAQQVLQNVFLAGGIIANQNGLGRDIWFVPFNQITNFLQIFFVFELLYALTLGIIKISICFLFLRLFPDKRIRRLLWGTQVFIVVLIVTYLIADLAQCQPMSYFWDMWDGDHVGRCNNLNGMAWSHAIINIALDLWMLALPASQVWGLNMPLRRKLGVMIMFGLGIFITIVSIIRLRSLIGFAQAYPQNPTMDFFGIAVWSALELTTGVTVACLPATRQVVVKYVPILPEVISKYTSRLSNSLSYVTASKSTKSELGKFTDISRDKTLQRIPTEDIVLNTLAMPARAPGSPAEPRPYSIATTPSSHVDGFSLGVFDGAVGDSTEEMSDSGNDTERTRPEGPLEANTTRPWRPMSYPQAQADRLRWH